MRTAEERANGAELSKELFSSQIVGEVNGLIGLLQVCFSCIIPGYDIFLTIFN